MDESNLELLLTKCCGAREGALSEISTRLISKR